MAASSWDTYVASVELLKTHGSVAAVKKAAEADPSIVTPLTVGLDAYDSVEDKIKLVASQVDIVIPVRVS